MQKFDPTHLAADHVTVELEIGSSILMAYGSILRQFIHLKVHSYIDYYIERKTYLIF